MKSAIISLLALAATSFGLTIPSVSERGGSFIPAIAGVDMTSAMTVYSQDERGHLMEAVWTESWENRTLPSFLPQPKIGSPFATIAKADGNIRIYYIGSDNLLKEACYDNNGPWYDGVLSKQRYAVHPESKVAATYLAGSGSQLVVRVYAQLQDGSIQEIGYNGSWSYLRNLGQACAGSSIAATSWYSGEASIRVYYQNSANQVVESCLDGTNSYTGQFVEAAMAGTPLSVLSFGDIHIRVYYVQAGGRMSEGAWDGSWYTGQWTDTYTQGTQIAAFALNDSNEAASPNDYNDGTVQLRVLLNRNVACDLEEWQYGSNGWSLAA